MLIKKEFANRKNISIDDYKKLISLYEYFESTSVVIAFLLSLIFNLPVMIFLFSSELSPISKMIYPILAFFVFPLLFHPFLKEIWIKERIKSNNFDR